MAGNLLMNISQDERERAIFRSRKKFQMDHASDMATAGDRGIEIGRQEEKIKRAMNLLDVLDLETIAERFELTAEEVENLKKH